MIMDVVSIKKQVPGGTTGSVARHRSDDLIGGDAFEMAVFTPVDRRIQILVRLLENNLNKQIAIAEIAKLVNLSPSRLAHLFKEEMELSIQQYITQLRLAKAKRQLETSFLSVKEIAASVGFSSVARFVACFKNVVGSTPSQYRKHLSNTAYHDAERSRQQDEHRDSRKRNY